MDWTEIPEGVGRSIDVLVWHEIVQDHQGDIPAFPSIDSSQLGKIVTLWSEDEVQTGSASVKITEFTHANFVAAMAGLISALPAKERLNSSDLFFSADAFTNSYSLCQTLVALYSGASIAINSVSGPSVDLTFAAKRIAPTVVVTSAHSAAELLGSASPQIQSGLPKLSHSMKSKSLAAGTMPKAGSFSGSTKSLVGSTPGSLRLLFISEKARAGDPPLSTHDLCDLRIFSGARIVYALTAAPVAGAVAQTHIYDYRKDDGPRTKQSHFGIPLSCLEIKLVDTADHKTSDEVAKGEVSCTYLICPNNYLTRCRLLPLALRWLADKRIFKLPVLSVTIVR
jgi:hypothetical protein